MFWRGSDRNKAGCFYQLVYLVNDLMGTFASKILIITKSNVVKTGKKKLNNVVNY